MCQPHNQVQDGVRVPVHALLHLLSSKVAARVVPTVSGAVDLAAARVITTRADPVVHRALRQQSLPQKMRIMPWRVTKSAHEVLGRAELRGEEGRRARNRQTTARKWKDEGIRMAGSTRMHKYNLKRIEKGRCEGPEWPAKANGTNSVVHRTRQAKSARKV